MITLETALVFPLLLALLAAILLICAPLGQMAFQSARLEVLSACEQLCGSSLYRSSPVRVGAAEVSSLQTSPQAIIELASLIRDYTRVADRLAVRGGAAP